MGLKTPKFTFKTENGGAWHSDTVHIKLKGVAVGAITAEAPFKIRFKVLKADTFEEGNPNCKWKWVRLHREFASLDEAKQFLTKDAAAICNAFYIYRER